MRLTSFLYISPLAAILFLSACNKQDKENVPPVTTETKNIQAADHFTWSTVQNVTAEIGSASFNPDGLLSRISLYIQDPASGAEPVASGSAGYDFNYSAELVIPAGLKGVWAGIIYPDGSSDSRYILLNNGRIDYIFIPGNKQDGFKSTESGPDCSTGCDVTISGSGQVTITGGKTYCVTTSFTGSINFEHWNGGGTLRICGNASPQNINNMGNDCHIVVAEGGKLTLGNLAIDGNGSITAWQNTTVNISSLNLNQSGTHLVNYSNQFIISGTFSPNGKVDNYGTLTITETYNANSQGYLNNSGTINVGKSLNLNNPLTNSGSLIVGESLNLNTNITFINLCRIVVQQSANLNAGTFTMDGGYLKANLSFTINGAGQFKMQNQSMVSTGNMTLNSSIAGSGSKSTIKTSGQATINGNKTVSGPIEWADNDAVLSNGDISQFINGATFVKIANATNYIPVTSCNPEGFGSQTNNDTDGDGVPDSSDNYPNDPARAYNNYYPSATGWASLAFEDMWPLFGDFDMNDIVVDVRFNRITNAQNKVVDLKNTYHVKAVGSSYRNGFAFQLDHVDIGSVQSVSGSVVPGGSYITLDASGLEDGTDKPVVVLWDDAENVINRAGGEFFNTIRNQQSGTSDLVNITVHFSVPQSMTTVGLPPYNHFLIQNGIREHEIHLPGNAPTSKADLSLFGTGNDASNPGTGKYYKSAGNLPWGLFIATSFDYPVERTDISSAHTYFSNWAQSSGTAYPDWYLNLPGYRNTSNIYGN